MKVELRGITVDINGIRILDDISLVIDAGAHVGLIGPNGSGKSTLLRCLYRAIEPSAGTVRVAGDDLHALRRKEAARRIAAVTQSESGHLGFTAGETVMLGRFAHGDAGSTTAARACADALAAVGATHLGPRSVLDLSGGERQRVLIARALAQDTPVLLLDEPLNHLDVRHQLDCCASCGPAPRPPSPPSTTSTSRPELRSARPPGRGARGRPPAPPPRC